MRFYYIKKNRLFLMSETVNFESDYWEISETLNLTDYIDTDFIFNMVDMASTALKITNSESKGIKKAPTLVQ